MAGDNGEAGDSQNAPVHQHQRRGFLPPQIVELMVPPLHVGAWSGVAGALAGVGGAIIRDTNPFVSGVVSGAQWFTLGGSYWFTRSAVMKAYGGEHLMRPSDKTVASAFAGSVAGAVSGLTRGPAKIIPAMAIWATIGAGGQIVANRARPSEPRSRDESGGWLSKLSPLKKLTDREYIDMMEEKILKVDVDIALIDDRIASLRAADEETGGIAKQETKKKGG